MWQIDHRLEEHGCKTDSQSGAGGVASLSGGFYRDSKGQLVIWRTLLEDSRGSVVEPCLWHKDGQLFTTAGDGGLLRIISAELDSKLLDAGDISVHFALC
jgi:methionyl-tRNA formyltransferase